MFNSQITDIKEYLEKYKPEYLEPKSKILVTGATGLIGSTLAIYLLLQEKGYDIVCPVRRIEKANGIYGELKDRIRFVECDVMEYLSNLSEHFDYIVHCASPTSGQYMVEYPSETYEFITNSMQALLHYARREHVKGILYISSIEYYGQNDNDMYISEDFVGYIDPNSRRSSYPLAKRAAEYLCTVYAKEYGINVMTARLTQTFGVGVQPTDNRVFAQFARSIIEKEDIVLYTTGESSKPYCYTTDCIAAIIRILLSGEKGEAYNVANQDTYISIKELANFMVENFCNDINVRMDIQEEKGYAPATRINMSAYKLMKLGWRPMYGLKEMFERLINSLRERTGGPYIQNISKI